MTRKFEAWHDQENCDITFIESTGVGKNKKNGIIPSKAKLLFVIKADTTEEARAVYHIRLGLSPYKPIGKAKKCPNKCGAFYYPKGSGECPNCGQIN